MKSIKITLKEMIKNLSPFKQVFIERDQLKVENEQLKGGATWVPIGHFYSPIPDIAEIKQREAEGGSECTIKYCRVNRFITEMPLCLNNKGGSIWLRKK